MEDDTAPTLRAHAHRLRLLVIEIERAPVLSLDQHAGDETWRGARPHLCVALLRTHQARLHGDAEDLRWQAQLFEQRAAGLDHLTAMQSGHPR